MVYLSETGRLLPTVGRPEDIFSLIANAKLDTYLDRKLFLDAGKSRHMSNDLYLLTEIRTVDKALEMGEGTLVDIEYVGTIPSEVTMDGRRHTIQVAEVTYVPDLKNNLLSVSRL